jgi:putative flippase GtrA
MSEAEDAGMTVSQLTFDGPATAAPITTVEIVVPVYNEEADLEASVRRLHAYLSQTFPLSWLVTIVDNGSTDRTWEVSSRLVDQLDGVRAAHLDEKGRGRALRAAWSASIAPVVAYMDVDLSTDLGALLPLVAPLVSGHSDVAIGTRLAPGARVVRGPKRELISRAYNLLLKATLHNGFSDAQCGFKAMRTDVARALLPVVEDEGWFFDTELLVLAEHNGLRIHEVPVDWVDDPDSRVDVVQTAKDDLRGVVRMLRRIARGEASVELPPAQAGRALGTDADLRAQLARFASVGVASTILFGVLVAVLAGPFGLLLADLAALALSSVVNTAAHRRLTFSLRGRAGRRRHFAGGLVLAVLPLVLTFAALAGVALAHIGSLWLQVLVLTAASSAAALARFTLFRRFVFGAGR